MNEYYKELIKKVHPDVNPHLVNATRICQEVNRWKDNPSMLKDIALKYNIKVSFVDGGVKIEFVEGARVFFITPSKRRVTSYSGVICAVKDVKSGDMVGAKEFSIKLETKNGSFVYDTKVKKVKTFDAARTFTFRGKLSETEFAPIKELFLQSSRAARTSVQDDPRFSKFGLKPNTEYGDRMIRAEVRVNGYYRWVTIIKTTANSIKYVNFYNRSGYGVVNIEKVFDVTFP